MEYVTVTAKPKPPRRGRSRKRQVEEEGGQEIDVHPVSAAIYDSTFEKFDFAPINLKTAGPERPSKPTRDWPTPGTRPPPQEKEEEEEADTGGEKIIPPEETVVPLVPKASEPQSSKPSATQPSATDPQRQKPEAETFVPLKRVKAQESQVMKNFMERVTSTVMRGLDPLYTFIGIVATSLGDGSDVRPYYRWRGEKASLETLQNPVVTEGVQSVEDFIRKNKHLGQEFLSVILTVVGPTNTTKAEPIGELISLEDEMFLDQMLNRVMETDELIQQDWIFGILDEAVFKFILDATSLGALAMALSKIRRIPNCSGFTLRQLIMSESVRDMFGLFVAYQYLLSSGGNAYASRKTNAVSKGKVDGTTFMLSAGFQTRTALARQIETAEYWFQEVGAMANPNLKAVQDEVERLEREYFVKAPPIPLDGVNMDDLFTLYIRMTTQQDGDLFIEKENYLEEERRKLKQLVRNERNARVQTYNYAIFLARLDYLKTRGAEMGLNGHYDQTPTPEIVTDDDDFLAIPSMEQQRANYYNLKAKYRRAKPRPETPDLLSAYDASFDIARKVRAESKAKTDEKVRVRKQELRNLDLYFRRVYNEQVAGPLTKYVEYQFFLQKKFELIRGVIVNDLRRLDIMKRQLAGMPKTILVHW